MYGLQASSYKVYRQVLMRYGSMHCVYMIVPDYKAVLVLAGTLIPERNLQDAPTVSTTASKKKRKRKRRWHHACMCCA